MLIKLSIKKNITLGMKRPFELGTSLMDQAGNSDFNVLLKSSIQTLEQILDSILAGASPFDIFPVHLIVFRCHSAYPSQRTLPHQYPSPSIPPVGGGRIVPHTQHILVHYCTVSGGLHLSHIVWYNVYMVYSIN